MNKKIVTIVPFEWHLDIKFFNKDIIQIWLTFIKEKWFDSEFWTINKDIKKNNFVYENQKWVWYKNIISIFFKLIFYSRKINLLHLYHISRYSYILWLTYKILNPKWKIYIKTDISVNNFNGKKIKNINKYLLIFFYSFTDYIWFEDKEILNFMKNKYKSYWFKFIFIPSWTIKISNYIWLNSKDNIISLCWRFWAEEKNYELLLNTLDKYDISFLEWWKIQLIWDMNIEFRKKLENLLEKKKELIDIIKICWFVYKKSELYELLYKSKIFIHTANSEWEPNVQFDAMFCWNYMLSTNVWTIKQNYQKKYSNFFEINNCKSLYLSFKKVVNLNKNLDISNYNKIQQHCLNNFIWEKSLENILNKF